MATLIIWNNHYYPFSAYPGHAALNITDDWSNLAQGTDYVSWWPDDGDKLKPRASPQLSISQDLALEGYAPDHILQIPGLLVGPMLAKWGNIRNDPAKVYRFLRQNCSTVVGQVLKEGSPLGSKLERNNLVWTPLKCLRLGQAMGGVEMRWTTFLSTLHRAGHLSRSDVAVLSHLFKRDAKHGKNATGNLHFYAKGKSVASKSVLVWQGHHAGKAKPGMSLFQSCEGSLLSSGTIQDVTENGAVMNWQVGDKKL